MNLLRLALPGVLVVYFVWKATRARIFLLGIPFLMFINRAVFFQDMKPFWTPGRLETSDLVMMWLVIVWVICRDLLLPTEERSALLSLRRDRWQSIGWEESTLVLIGALALTNVLITTARYGEFLSALGQSRFVFYLLLGYILIRDLISRAAPEDVDAFLGAIVMVNTIAAVLFIAHQGLHLQIYDATEYQVFTFMGQRLTRSFYFMPPLLLLSISYAFAKRRLGVQWALVAIITLVALWISYTRSLLIIAVVEVIIVMGLRLIYSNQAAAVIRRAVMVLVAGVVVGALVYVLLPVQTEYFLSRFDRAGASGVTGDRNLVSRGDDVRTVYEWIKEQDPVLGAGFASQAQDTHVRLLDAMSSDIVWVPVLYRLGIAGAVLLVLLFAGGVKRGVGLLRPADPHLEVLGLALTAFLVGILAQGFVSWTFMDPDRFPMGLWMFAFISGLAAGRARRGEVVDA